MFYTVYKITNLINGKFYIGKHRTKNLNDGYFGSGKLLRQAITKYGLDNFKKEILEVCKTEEQMNLAERILVVIDYEVSYNLCFGGGGDFDYINRNGIGGFSNRKHSDKTKELLRERRKGKRLFTPSEEYKHKMSLIMKAKHKSNPNFNRCRGVKVT
jgi:hypothetical protein